MAISVIPNKLVDFSHVNAVKMKHFIQYFVFLILIYEYKSDNLCTEHCPNDENLEFIWSGYKYKLCTGMACSQNRSQTLMGSVKVLILEFCEYLPRCSMRNLSNLESLYAVNAGLNNLAPLALNGLVKLKDINLSFNFLRVINFNVFTGLNSVRSLDLSWNEIRYVEQEAFEGMPNLEILNISRNYLKTLAGNLIFFDNNEQGQHTAGQFFLFVERLVTMKIKKIDLSYNNLESVKCGLASELDVLNLSHNKMRVFELAGFFDYKFLNHLDLTNNKLLQCNFLTSHEERKFINKLRVSYNEIKSLDCPLEQVHTIALQGNPWRCDSYINILKTLIRNNVTLLTHEKDENVYFLNEDERRNYPYCVAGSHKNKDVLRFTSLKEIYRRRKNPPCGTSYNCPDNMVCKNYQCWDPCKHNVCHRTSVCITKNHSYSCQCPTGTLKNPHEISSRCYRVECFETTDCNMGAKCVSHICV